MPALPSMQSHAQVLCKSFTLLPEGKAEKPGTELVLFSEEYGSKRKSPFAVGGCRILGAVKNCREVETEMHDPIIHTEKTAEKQDLERVAQEKDAPCAIPASRKNWEAEVKCSCSLHNPLDRTGARPGLWQVSDLQPKIRES